MPTLPEIFSGVAAFLVVYYFKELSTDVKAAVNSIKELNGKVGVIIERTDRHDKEIDKLRTEVKEVSLDLAVIKGSDKK